MIRIIATPENMASKGRIYSVSVEGGPTLGKTRLPFMAGARMLIEAGYPADDLVTMRHAGAKHDSFAPAPLGKVAKWTISEPDATSARCVTFQDRFSGVASSEISPISGVPAGVMPDDGDSAVYGPFSEGAA